MNTMALVNIAAFALLVLFILRSWINPDPRKMLSDYVMFIHATLGMGKTAVVAHWVRRVLNPYSWADRLISWAFRRPLPAPPVIYATFELAGCKPLDVKNGEWPRERGAKVVIDEYLLLESNELIPLPWLSKGVTLARQFGQQVVIISQSSRLPNRHRKFSGTVGLWLTMKGISFGKWGRLIILKRAAEPFVRRTKGFKADGQKTSLVWIPGSVFKTYNSRKIYGYSVDLEGNWTDEGTAANAEGVDNQGAAHESDAPRADGAAHAPKKKRVHRVKKVLPSS